MKKLNYRRETIRELTDQDLVQAEGAKAAPPRPITFTCHTYCVLPNTNAC